MLLDEQESFYEFHDRDAAMLRSNFKLCNKKKERKYFSIELLNLTGHRTHLLSQYFTVLFSGCTLRWYMKP